MSNWDNCIIRLNEDSRDELEKYLTNTGDKIAFIESIGIMTSCGVSINDIDNVISFRIKNGNHVALAALLADINLEIKDSIIHLEISLEEDIFRHKLISRFEGGKQEFEKIDTDFDFSEHNYDIDSIVLTEIKDKAKNLFSNFFELGEGGVNCLLACDKDKEVMAMVTYKIDNYKVVAKLMTSFETSMFGDIIDLDIYQPVEKVVVEYKRVEPSQMINS